MRPERTRVLPAAALALALAVAAPAALPGQDALARIVAAEPYPLRGEPVELTVTTPDGRPLAGVPVIARYRPNSETAHAEELGLTDSAGRVRWVPTDAGVVMLDAAGEDGAPPLAQTRVAVRYGGFPALGLTVVIVAAVLLFGGAGLGFRMLLTAPRRLPTEEPPST